MAGDRADFRYARHLLLDGWDQAVLERSTVLVVGIGALGCEIVKDLTLVGVGTLHLVDMDVVETSNLSRQMLFHEADRGRPKADVAAERVRAMNPRIKAVAHVGRFQDLPADLVSSVDVIAGGLDSIDARLELNRLAWRLGKVYIDSASTGYKGNVHVVVPPGNESVSKRTACMRCFYPIPPTEAGAAAACTIPGHARTREHCILKGEEAFVKEMGEREDYTVAELERIAALARQASIDSPFMQEQTFSAPEVENVVENKLPAIITVNAVVASVLSHEVLKALHRLKGRDIGPLLDPPYIEYSSAYGIFTQVEIERDDGCPVCSETGGLADLDVGGPTLGDLLAAVGGLGIDVSRALVTNADGGRVLSQFGSGEPASQLKDLGVGHGTVVRVTYMEGGERRSVMLNVIVEAGG